MGKSEGRCEEGDIYLGVSGEHVISRRLTVYCIPTSCNCVPIASTIIYYYRNVF